MTIEMKERPIPFMGPMVRKILDGIKTQTRRPVLFPKWADSCEPFKDGVIFTGFERESFKRCPFGQPGDRLWVRETWAVRNKVNDSRPIWEISFNRSHFEIWYAADCLEGGREKFNLDFLGKWRPSIHMPRPLSRITLEVTKVRMERLQDMPPEDVYREGHEPTSDSLYINIMYSWESIYAARGFGWDKNPWVWVIDFRRVNA